MWMRIRDGSVLNMDTVSQVWIADAYGTKFSVKAEMAEDSLTIVQCDTREAAQEAIDMILDAIRGGVAVLEF